MNFNIIKYNLYEILNVNPMDDISIIKKKYIKTIKRFHPDKNSELEEDIYYHIILAGKILLDTELKKKYDQYLTETIKSYVDLKNNFDTDKKDIKIIDSKESQKIFNIMMDELNIKHGYNNNANESVKDRYNVLLMDRNNLIINNDIKNAKELNTKFNEMIRRMDIIEYVEPYEISNDIFGEKYISIEDINKLYINDSIQNHKYTSLDRAFEILTIKHNQNQKFKSIETGIEEYNNFTDQIKKKL